MTTREWAPWPDDIHMRTWDPYSLEIYGMCENKLPTSRLLKVITLQPANARISLGMATFRHVTKMAVTSLDPSYSKTPCYMIAFIEPELWEIEVYIAGIGILDLFCSCGLDPMTFVYEPDPYSLKIHRICKYELPIRQGFRKLSSGRQT